jgi:hypothetical protein
MLHAGVLFVLVGKISNVVKQENFSIKIVFNFQDEDL